MKLDNNGDSLPRLEVKSTLQFFLRVDQSECAKALLTCLVPAFYLERLEKLKSTGELITGVGNVRYLERY